MTELAILYGLMQFFVTCAALFELFHWTNESEDCRGVGRRVTLLMLFWPVVIPYRIARAIVRKW